MKDLFIGNNPVFSDKKEVTGAFVLIDHEKFYQIKNFDVLSAFFISIASNSNHWMYLSSNGGLTAGRKNPDQALFPYYTDDKIHDSAEITGSKTILQVYKNGRNYLWEPFSDRNKGVYTIERSLLKSTTGNKIIFQEKNTDFSLSFSYTWMNSEDFGWIKKSRLTNDSLDTIKVSIVDGLQNILPSGIDRLTQNTFSTLVDGYKKTELIEQSGLALFRMESILVDRAEPSESLRVNTVWTHGLENAHYLLDSKQLDAFRNGREITYDTESKGVRGAFFACSPIILESAVAKTWYFVAELNQDAAQVNNLIVFIENTKERTFLLEQSVEKGTKMLQSMVAQVDGIQQTADENETTRHFSNVLFNCMRGGIFSDDYTIQASDFSKHVKHFNVKVWERQCNFLSRLPVTINYFELEEWIYLQKDNQFYRLFLEYLPLTFSRRHGDPSRPWNTFDIHIKDEAGNKILSYQGNWRDIFQNWEALSLSFPGYINGIIAKFLNATTADGYNPYKITNEGIEWEVIEPENPWSNIGYWGDHQIIYLLKLLEISRSHYPERLGTWLDRRLFDYANVPYRLKSYAEIVSNPKSTIRFDGQLHDSILKQVQTYGADARLILNKRKEVLLVSFTEKILSTLLSKLSNFIPEAGIWMNTLRPEWNDANNALVGSGASMVTLYHLRRFVAFMLDLYEGSKPENFSVSEEILGFFEEVYRTLLDYENLLLVGFNDKQRRNSTDALGNAGNSYRDKIYKGFSETTKSISRKKLQDFFVLTLRFIDQSIQSNKRADAMYHAYNLVNFTEDSIVIRPLYEMLEGQVAVLSSGKLTAKETLDLLKTLRSSSLYRADQQSYMLYPNKKLPLFLDKNNIPAEDIENIPFLKELMAAGDTSIVTKDLKGCYHFNAGFRNVGFLTEALLQMKTYSAFVIRDEEQIALEQLYERIFDHQSFTGRSGTFYKYEGLGCIYWHMVSKLLLAIGESIQRAANQITDPEIWKELISHYWEVKKGIGSHKSPAEYGSFPFDPYSHTPLMAGVQQPGMTGQVKEDILSRFFELGMSVRDGQLIVQPVLLKKDAFIQPAENGEKEFPMLRFSYCSKPFTYLIDGKEGIEILQKEGPTIIIKDYILNHNQSAAIFNRDPGIKAVIVHFKNAHFLG